MKILVCGGRKFGLAELAESETQWMHGVLDGISETHELMFDDRVRHLVHGGAPGADSIAHEWAVMRGVSSRSYPADWKAYGKAAGPIRNAEMLAGNKDIGLVIAFPGGVGTADMVRKAKAAGFRVIELKDLS